MKAVSKLRKIDYTPIDGLIVAYELNEDGSYLNGKPLVATEKEKNAVMVSGSREDYLNQDGQVECYTITI